MIPEMPPQRNVKPQTGEKLYCLTGDRRAPADQPPGRFVADSPLEGDGFEPSVPRPRRALSGPLPLVAAKGRRRRSRHCGSARFLLLGKPFHRAAGVHGFGGLRFVALLGGFCLPAVQLIYTFAFHRLDQQFAERPYQGINAVRRIPRGGPVDIRGKICHLVFELREGADVMDAALLVERRHRFGPHHLAARGADRWPSTLRTSGMGSAYGFGGIGKNIGPIGLALIVGSSNIVKPDVTIERSFPVSFISGPGRRSRALPMPLSGSRQGPVARRDRSGTGCRTRSGHVRCRGVAPERLTAAAQPYLNKPCPTR